ncbi:hypothetical protein PR048_014487 [Dryococelus australis]|uniref:Uncharacterized protein n=1 Tax=Dryococelus australis TaxID=614101 RepID=A0ABQ9HEB9_9NEOP|nr:hypothetical protein PR048_014487 [Dryococelus australis]
MKILSAAGLACSHPTKATRVQSLAGSPNFRKWESCMTMPLVGEFSRGSPVSSAPSFRRRSILTSITNIGSEDHAVKSHPTLFTHFPHKWYSIVCAKSAWQNAARGCAAKVCGVCLCLTPASRGREHTSLAKCHSSTGSTARLVADSAGLVGRVTAGSGWDGPQLGASPAQPPALTFTFGVLQTRPVVGAVLPLPSRRFVSSGFARTALGQLYSTLLYVYDIHYLPKSNLAPVHNVCSVVVTPLESRRAISCGYNSSHPVWHAIYECLQNIHGDSSLFLLQQFHELSNGFRPLLTSPHPAIQFVPKMFYRVEVGAKFLAMACMMHVALSPLWLPRLSASNVGNSSGLDKPLAELHRSNDLSQCQRRETSSVKQIMVQNNIATTCDNLQQHVTSCDYLRKLATTFVNLRLLETTCNYERLPVTTCDYL